MKIGLYNLEPNIVNTAMMKDSTYHKAKGDEAEIYNPLFREIYHDIYSFSIFKYTDKGYVTNEMIKGGSGFDIKSKLDPEIEVCDYDWSLYPKCDYSIVWFSRGCIRDCPFCIVRQKEGYISPVEPKNLNPNGKYIRIQDNNFFANPKWREAIKQINEWGQPIDFSGGINARILTKEICLILLSLKYQKSKDKSTIKKIKIAWDNPREDIIPQLKEILKYIKPYRLMCYVLIGYWSSKEEDLYRVEELRKLGIDPFVMPYNKRVRYEMDFSRWVNFKAIFKSVKWEEYKNDESKIY